MFDTLYIEEAVSEHPRTRSIMQRFKGRQIIECKHYGELFNPKAQSFRLQKTRPALILAHKTNEHVLPAPIGYAIGAQHNYYFSHMLNCVYDCRYCFLQGMYRSAHTVLFVNYEDFINDIAERAKQHTGEPVHFFSGYDGDSLAMEPLSGFAGFFIEAMRDIPNAWLEIRSKSTQTRQLLKIDPWPQAIVACSFTPQNISQALEHKVPGLQQRLDALRKLQQAGWPIGLRLDPLIYTDNYEQEYRELIDLLMQQLDSRAIHSVSFGTFRMPEQFFNNMTRLYPEERLFAGALQNHQGMVSYAPAVEEEMRSTCESLLLEYLDKRQLFPCIHQTSGQRD